MKKVRTSLDLACSVLVVGVNYKNKYLIRPSRVRFSNPELNPTTDKDIKISLYLDNFLDINKAIILFPTKYFAL